MCFTNFGQFYSNGRIVLVNQAGIYFGSGSRVDVGGMIASAVDIKDENFMNKLVFVQEIIQALLLTRERLSLTVSIVNVMKLAALFQYVVQVLKCPNPFGVQF